MWPALPDHPAREFEAGRQALIAGAFDEAALRFGLALRLAPALAPAVLEATEGARAASLSVVRGDAYRSAGHEIEARQAYAIAAQGGLPERRSTVRVRPKPMPVPVAPDEGDDLDVVTDADGVAGLSAEAGAPDEPAADGSTDGRDHASDAVQVTDAAGNTDSESHHDTHG